MSIFIQIRGALSLDRLAEHLMRIQKELDVFAKYACFSFWIILVLVFFVTIYFTQNKGKFLLLTAVILSILLSFAVESPPKDKPEYYKSSSEDMIKVLSYNLRGASLVDGSDDDWLRGRNKRSIDLLFDVNADVIGVQEGQADSILYLLSVFKHYKSIYLKGEESFSILYNQNRLVLEDSSYFFLSETPKVKSVAEGSRFIRVCHWGLFSLRENSEKKFYVFNVHLDPFSESARRIQAKYLIDYINKMNLNFPAILTGDFNSVAGASVYSLFVDQMNIFKYFSNGNNEKKDWVDAWKQSKYRYSDTITTFHGFTGLQLESYLYRVPLGFAASMLSFFETPMPWRPWNFHIDWILQYKRNEGLVQPLNCEWISVIRKPDINNRFASDHYPLLGVFSF